MSSYKLFAARAIVLTPFPCLFVVFPTVQASKLPPEPYLRDLGSSHQSLHNTASGINLLRKRSPTVFYRRGCSRSLSEIADIFVKSSLRYRNPPHSPLAPERHK